MTTLEVLVKSRALIVDPKKWCKRADALTEDGTKVHPRDLRAVKRCAIGAIFRTSETIQDEGPAEEALNSAIKRLGLRGYIEDVNDTTDHATVMKVFDNAIRHERNKQRKEKDK